MSRFFLLVVGLRLPRALSSSAALGKLVCFYACGIDRAPRFVGPLDGPLGRGRNTPPLHVARPP